MPFEQLWDGLQKAVAENRVSGLSPLAMWEAMHAGDDLGLLRRQLPEEFWQDFDSITGILRRNVADLLAAVKVEAEKVAGLSDKEVGLRLGEFPEEVRRCIFPHCKSGGDLLGGRTKDLVYRTFARTGTAWMGTARRAR